MKKFLRKNWIDFVAVPIGLSIFVAPFILIFLTASKNSKESYQFNFEMPEKFLLWENIKTVLETSDGVVIRAFFNSTILTLVSVTLVVFVSSMAAFIFARRPGKLTTFANIMVLAGLVVPPAVVPTIWVLQRLHLFKTLPGLIFIEVAYSAAFSILIYKGFIASIPREIDEAAAMDGCTGFALYRRIIFPLLMPVNVTIIVTTSVAIFNDFTNPLYFLPGNENATVQLTLFYFQSAYLTQYNLLFTDILLITIPPLIVFIIFNKKIVSGLTAGSVKG
ncbi:UgpE ABC-type sugar transport system, permease component [Candidatus Nanopelagicaceae bacterium]|jgi:raffinose/stachyose/melibiose transport system permease protein